MSSAYLGIDVGGTSVKLAAVENGQVLWTGQSTSYSRPTTQQLVAALRTAAEGRELSMAGVGLCVPGLMDKPRRMITLSVNVPGLNGVVLDDLVRMGLGERLGHLKIVNDGFACGHDIWTSRNLSGRLMVMPIGTGIGICVLDDGVPLMVSGESPGHIGQVDVSIEGEHIIGPDGGAGALEGYLGAPALARKYGDSFVAVKSFKGDEPALMALAGAVRICHAIYRPQHVVLAGGIGIRLGRVLDKIKAMIDKDLTSVARPGWTLSVGDSDFHAAAGAAKLAAKA